MKRMLHDWLTHQGMNDALANNLIGLGAIVLLVVAALIVDAIVKRVLLRILHKIAKRSKTLWDDYMVQRGVFDRAAHLASAMIIYSFAPTAMESWPQLAGIVQNIASAYMVLVVTLVLDALLTVFLDIYQTTQKSKTLALRPVIQAARTVVWLVGSILILASVMDKSPAVFFSGLGAMTAVLMLIFKDSILGLVAGVQIATNDLVRKGDWIEMPKYGADGDVIEVGMTTVRVQNWNKTISTIPSYALISDSFKNWRGMDESGGRRIKRSIALDMNSTRFCDEEMIARFRKIEILNEYIDRKLVELTEYNTEHDIDDKVLVNGRRMTNLGTFRAYLVAYLRRHPKIHDDMTLLVRQLQPSSQGLPMEIYVFSRDQRWGEYEGIQSDIFDHILAVVPEFDLRVYQAPTGKDLAALGGGHALT